MTRKLRPQDYLLLATFLMALSACLVWLQEGTQETQHRRLNLRLSSSSDHSTFKILQLADLHFGEAPGTDWGPEQDANTWKVLESIIPKEKPDFIVLSGDQITANDIDENAAAVYRKLCEHLEQYNIPWAMIFGNHDDAPLETPDEEDEEMILFTPPKTSRSDLYHVDHSFAPLSLTQLGPQTLFGTSNYVTNVHDAAGQVALQILFLDSGGGALPKQLEASQVEWFQQKRHADTPLVAFQHIPTQDFEYDGDKCEGMQDEGVDAIESDPGIVDALAQDGNVQFLAVGHNHGLDYCCSYEESDLHLCFGRHSGYGGYGRWDRGARIYEIQIGGTNSEASSDGPTLKWKSWVRLESGDIEDEYNPFGDEEEEEEDNE